MYAQGTSPEYAAKNPDVIGPQKTPEDRIRQLQQAASHIPSILKKLDNPGPPPGWAYEKQPVRPTQQVQQSRQAYTGPRPFQPTVTTDGEPRHQYGGDVPHESSSKDLPIMPSNADEDFYRTYYSLQQLLNDPTARHQKDYPERRARLEAALRARTQTLEMQSKTGAFAPRGY